MARVGFSVERMVFDRGQSGYQEVELAAFSIGLDDPERNTKRVFYSLTSRIDSLRRRPERGEAIA